MGARCCGAAEIPADNSAELSLSGTHLGNVELLLKYVKLAAVGLLVSSPDQHDGKAGLQLFLREAGGEVSSVNVAPEATVADLRRAAGLPSSTRDMPLSWAQAPLFDAAATLADIGIGQEAMLDVGSSDHPTITKVAFAGVLDSAGILDSDVDLDGKLYLTLTRTDAIFKLNVDTKEVDFVVGSTNGCEDGLLTEAKFSHPHNLAVFGDRLFILDNCSGSRGSLREFNFLTNRVRTVASNFLGINSAFPSLVADETHGTLYVASITNPPSYSLDSYYDRNVIHKVTFPDEIVTELLPRSRFEFDRVSQREQV